MIESSAEGERRPQAQQTMTEPGAAAPVDADWPATQPAVQEHRLEIRFTGSGTAGLLLAQDKIITKQLLGYHEVLTPNFATFDGETFEITPGRVERT